MRAHRWTQAAMVGILGVYLLVLLVPALHAPGWLRDDLIGNLALVLPVIVLARWGADQREDRVWTLALAIGMTLYLCGNLLYTVADPLGDRSFPTVADIGYLGVYPFLLAGLLIALRTQIRHASLVVALDGLCATAASAAAATWAVAPVMDHVWDGSLGAVATLAYPVFAIVLIAASVGVLGAVATGQGWHLVLWALGMVIFAVGDIVYAYRLAYDEYQLGTWLDGVWALGLVLLTLGATNLREPAGRHLPRARSLIVVAAAMSSAVVVLAAAPSWADNAVPSVLALLTLVGCAVRLLLAFWQLRELAAIRQQAMTDELTGAANRRALYAEMDRLLRLELDGDGDEPGTGFGLALIDLDHFKEVNDSYGHAAGDELLRAVVSRFARALEGLQTPHLLARLGGDEFAVILHEVSSQDAAVACGTALHESLADPVILDDVALHVQASFGLAVAPEHARNRGDMLFAADAAMYAAKTSGEPVCFYSPSAVGDRRNRLEVAEDLYSALERGELTVEYQPIVTIEGDLVAAEALVRWDHPTRGRLSPAEFLEIAERYRLTPSIAHRVLDVTLADLQRWRAGGNDLRTSVNVSASDLRDEALVSTVAGALLKYDVPPCALTIEITETAMMRNPEMAHTVMHALAELGVELAVDDYGTGYSSLEYLLKLPIKEIKLDRAFSKNLVEELRSVAIVRSTIDLTHALGLRMVAEGVEDEPTLVILRDLGCDLMQGWHLGRPMPAADFERLLRNRLGGETPSAVKHEGSSELSA